jgi:dihydroflavonol-4-reductase
MVAGIKSESPAGLNRNSQFAVFDPVVRSRLFGLGRERRVSSEKARKMLGWTTRPASESILDTVRSLQAEGLV